MVEITGRRESPCRATALAVIKRCTTGALAGGLSAKFASLTTSVAFAEADASGLDETELKFRARVVKNASVPVKDVMLKIRGTIDANADLMDALKAIYKNKIVVLPVLEDGKLVGLLRDSDLFLAMADILIE